MKYFKPISAFLGTFLLFSTHLLAKTKIQYLFAHGLGSTEGQASYYQQNSIIMDQIHTFSFPDAENGIVDYNKSSLAQNNEIERINEAYQIVCTNTRKPQIVLAGMSRGASTIINFMGQYNPKEVKALVLESPFDSIDTVLNQKLNYYWLSWLPFGLEIAQWVASSTYGQYQPEGLRPIEQITKIKNKNLPILFICSKQDVLIPWESTYALYQACKNEGFSNAHIVVVNHGAHGYLLEDISKKSYQKEVHIFYKKYKLPHNTQFLT